MLDEKQVREFASGGFALARGAVAADTVAALRARALADLAADRGPLEREADVGYPGAPRGVEAPGGGTVRRLLRAYERGGFRGFVHDARLRLVLARLLGSDDVRFVQAHHNCIMTKQPRYSSDTGWHQDVRYWSFTDRRLVNAWLALTPEASPNGSLRLLPGTHREELGRERFDDALFLRTDLPENQPLLARAVQVELEPGDVLFFDAGLFHHATRNYTARPKLSAVFTFHGPVTRPLAGTKSAALPEIPLAQPAEV